MKYTNVIKLHNIKMRFTTNSSFIANIISDQLRFDKFRTHYKKYITVSLNLEEINCIPSYRYEFSITDKNNLSLDCWFKNIRTNVYPDKNSVAGKILMPTILSNAEILDLLIIHPLRHILKYKNIFMVHAAALAKDNKGVLICGLLESGKSTLAVKLVEDRFKFLSDEFIIFDKTHLFSFPIKIRLGRDSIKIFSKLKNLAEKTHKGREKISFHIQDFYPDCRIESCAPAIIVFPKPQKKPAKITIQSINKETAFSLLCLDKENSLPFEKNLIIRQKQIQSLARLVERTESYYLSYGLDKIDEASKIINNLLTHHHCRKAR